MSQRLPPKKSGLLTPLDPAVKKKSDESLAKVLREKAAHPPTLKIDPTDAADIDPNAPNVLHAPRNPSRRNITVHASTFHKKEAEAPSKAKHEPDPAPEPPPAPRHSKGTGMFPDAVKKSGSNITVQHHTQKFKKPHG